MKSGVLSSVENRKTFRMLSVKLFQIQKFLFQNPNIIPNLEMPTFVY